MSTTDFEKWESADGLTTCYVYVRPADPPYPAAVRVECDSPGGCFDFSVLPDCAARLATTLDRAAHRAETLNLAVRHG